jgi:hypothetical protein
MTDDIKYLMTKVVVEHLQEHPGLDFINATRKKEIDINTSAVVCTICGKEFSQKKKKIIGIEDLDAILGKYHMNDIAVIENTIGRFKILRINIQIVEENHEN